MNDLQKDLSKKFLSYLDNKQFQRLQFEAEMLGDIDKQDPIIIFYYALSIYLKDTSTTKDLLYSASLFEKIYLLNKKNLQPLYNLLAVSFKTKVFKNVLILTIEAYKRNKNDPKLIEGLARINFYLGNRELSIKFFKKLYEMFPEKTEGRLPFISSYNYTSGVSQEEYLKECLLYASLVEKKLDIKNENFQFNHKKTNKIHIGFLSADFKTHSVSFFLKDLLSQINKNDFKISLISNLKVFKQDNMSENLKKIVHNWYDVENYSDINLTIFLRSLNIDILFDLSGFTQGNRFEVLARKCAKVQIGWLGYNNSLGIKNMDYLISDRNLIKPDEFKLYSEKILFMPKIWNALSFPSNLPDINEDLRENNSFFTFCSFNNFQKLSDRTISVWSEILLKSDSKIMLKNSLLGGEDLKENVLKKFINFGVKKYQLIFLDHQKDLFDHLNLYNRANLALDTFPFPGVTTSYESILMGLPVLTMKGYNFNSRCGESINKNINMEDFIADDNDDYVKKAIFFAKSNNLKKDYGNKLRQRAFSSSLFDTKSFTKNFEDLIKEVYSKI